MSSHPDTSFSTIGNPSAKVLLGVTGGIAAYKSPDLARRLRERGCAVRAVMTPAACGFITPLTLQAVTGQPVGASLLDETAEAAMGHIELARWADLVLIAPASADFIARLAAGFADDLLSTLCLATRAPIALAPAMNHVMWAAPATRDNTATIEDRGLHVMGPGQGDQACGEFGPGRMLEPADIADRAIELIESTRGGQTAPGTALAGVTVLVTAGPTREAIDPVRYISNHSSGKMGYSVAGAAARAGAEVTLISGPTALACPPGVHRLDVESAGQMHEAVMTRVGETGIFVAAAAVADYRPVNAAPTKIKKTGEDQSLALTQNPDILAAVAGLSPGPFTVGFAAETENVEANARTKLETKRLDMIAANHVGQPGSGFGADSNALDVYWRDGGAVERTELGYAPKHELADRLIALVAERYRQAS
ncbi:MAG: bifunctional phosphopantothenoylcysteine decarboxylase/phosphopantothenate--cysteine ligase CoaBC [Gammaproteobacteria bacterium]